MLDLTAIILTYNEALHIRRCLENVCPLVKRVVVIDSRSQDETVSICHELGVEVLEHEWPGNQAAQFNWALDTLSIHTEWIIRLDADEYLLPELKSELEQVLPTLPIDVTGIELRRRHVFMGRWMKHGFHPVMTRIFRTGIGRYDLRLMDEHISLSEGRTILMKHDFCDHTLINISDYCRKHIGYSVREAAAVLDEELQLSGNHNELRLGAKTQSKHRSKSRYYKSPMFWRCWAYFVYRYCIKGGFLDGKEGFLFNFIQAWWYRTMVDAKIYEIKKATDGDKENIRQLLKEKYQIDLTGAERS